MTNPKTRTTVPTLNWSINQVFGLRKVWSFALPNEAIEALPHVPLKSLWIGRCDELEANDLDDYDDTKRPITYRTFQKHVGAGITRSLDRRFGIPIGREWHVKFSRGKWQGKPAVCMMHSGYHHIWTV